MSASVFQTSSFSQMSRLLRASSSARRRPVAVDPQARSRATRCLFGPVDHEATRRFIAAELTEISLRDQLRWGFNFQMEKPLEDNTNTKQRFVWDPVGDHQVSEAYRLPSMDAAHETPIGTETAAPTTKSPAVRKTKSRTRRLVVAAAAASPTNLRQLKITGQYKQHTTN